MFVFCLALRDVIDFFLSGGWRVESGHLPGLLLLLLLAREVKWTSCTKEAKKCIAEKSGSVYGSSGWLLLAGIDKL